MSDQPFYAPNRKIALRQPRVGEHLWAIRKDGRQLVCELRDDGDWGVERQVYRDQEFLYSRRRATCRDATADVSGASASTRSLTWSR
jgi:hypothetical protein